MFCDVFSGWGWGAGRKIMSSGGRTPVELPRAEEPVARLCAQGSPCNR